MPKFEFTKTCGYIRPRNAGEVSELSDADCDNAAALGLGTRVNAELERTPEAPETQPEEVATYAETHGDPLVVDASSSATPAEEQAPIVPKSLACERGCNSGKPFGSAAALAAHRLTKHGSK
jgi:hypothetical protein